MAAYTGNILRLKAQEKLSNVPGLDGAHAEPSGLEGVPDYRADQISVPPTMGQEYAGLVLEDGVPRAVVAGQPSLGWNAPYAASTPVGSGGTPAGQAPGWTAGDPHNAAVDTSFAAAARGAIHGSIYRGSVSPVHAAGDDTLPARRANPVGVAGSSFLQRLAEFPREIWAEPTGAGADKFVAGTNSYSSSNPEGDQYATGRGGGQAFYGFESPYFVHQELYIDKPAQTYERRTAPVTARDPLVGGRYYNTPIMGQLASNPWLTELGEAVMPEGYGVPVDGVM
ncbi:MAG TPA: hypothetical protein VFY14_06975 [Streptomyces sp.]|nr:hypothetical protein [Streptomyces sp.]